MPIQTRQCARCATRYDVLVVRGEVVGGLDTPEGGTECPSCLAAEFMPLVTAGTGIDLGGEGGAGRFYPRFDRGLGCTVMSAAHRKQLGILVLIFLGLLLLPCAWWLHHAYWKNIH